MAIRAGPGIRSPRRSPASLLLVGAGGAASPRSRSRSASATANRSSCARRRITQAASAATKPASDPFAWRPREAARVRGRRGDRGLPHDLRDEPGRRGRLGEADRGLSAIGSTAAAERHGVDPDVLEGVIFLESAGRPDVIAGPTPESAAGLAQILPSTATDLLGMSVDLPQSIELTERISHSDSPGETDRLQAQRAAIDQRFDPEAAIEGAARYLEIAQDRFGDEQLAIASYHMGIGNLESVLRAYARADDSTPIGDLVRDGSPTPRSTSTPASTRHRGAWGLLTWVRRRVVGLSVEGARLRADHATSTATTRTRSRRPPSWRRTRRRWRRSFTPRTRPRSSTRRRTSPTPSQTAIWSPLPDEPGARMGAGQGHRRARRPSSTSHPSSTEPCARRRWRRSPIWRASSASRAVRRRRCR